ncbi:hypothetical protein N7517_007584, partial [Penicillium concentricum]
CHLISQHGAIAQLGERATEVRKVAGSIPARPIYISQHGAIAQLGERATEVRKVAGSIPARPIFVLSFCFLHTYSLCRLHKLPSDIPTWDDSSVGRACD